MHSLLLVGFPYELAPELVELTESNAAAAREIFDLVGKTTDVNLGGRPRAKMTLARRMRCA